MKHFSGLLMFLALTWACGSTPPKVQLTEEWPARAGRYEAVTADWTRSTTLRGAYQEVLDLSATFKSPEWRAAHAEREADHRRLTGQAKDQLLAQAQAEMASPYEVELLVTTWDRR